MRCPSLSLLSSVFSIFIAAGSTAGAQEAPPHATAPTTPDARWSTGTSWTPDTTPMSGIALKAGTWNLMIHGEAFAQALAESGNLHHRSRRVGSINWLMTQAERDVGRGQLTLHAMVSAEPWTVPGCGYPDLLATGEICNGDTIHDRQHPHDLWMELAAGYDWPLVGATRVKVYGGPSAEPALGPPPFMHRPSADGNPIAPIAHHSLDATHISFGVITAAVYGRRWKVDASAFNGREPDDRRANLDLDRMDSVSVRLSVNPTPSTAMQVSGGHLPEREAGLGAFPRLEVNLVTASAIVSRPWRAGSWAATAAYGLKWGPANITGTVIDQHTHAALLETSLSPSPSDTWFGRIEVVGKPAHDLHADEFAPAVFTVAKAQAGYVRYLPLSSVRVGIGGTVDMSLLPPLLAPRYEGRIAPGGGVFVRLAPGRHAAEAHHHSMN